MESRTGEGGTAVRERPTRQGKRPCYAYACEEEGINQCEGEDHYPNLWMCGNHTMTKEGKNMCARCYRFGYRPEH